MKLEGIKVVDLSWFLPGPYLTTALADHGATVIKVEPPGG
jgi:crotonobetainyl-CoA:carnitine CoA-transferase CaiB-like acyl-CoA transferase